jgi:hypothetical protein
MLDEPEILQNNLAENPLFYCVDALNYVQGKIGRTCRVEHPALWPMHHQQALVAPSACHVTLLMHILALIGQLEANRFIRICDWFVQLSNR